ncbi:MAG TPA: MAPEG family protein [Caulobacteraceae bacterium]|nr:MAPEG family protein [Caulobacteraceae bacterium]
MNHPYNLTSLVTVAAIIVFIVAGLRVGRARGVHGVAAPATTGHEIFERHFRVQMNTLEQLVMFLPGLWLWTAYWGELIAVILGLIWIVGRCLYMVSYVRDPKSREVGFFLTVIPTMVLLIGSIVGAIRAMMATGGVW